VRRGVTGCCDTTVSSFSIVVLNSSLSHVPQFAFGHESQVYLFIQLYHRPSVLSYNNSITVLRFYLTTTTTTTLLIIQPFLAACLSAQSTYFSPLALPLARLLSLSAFLA
jgi:hypothetical protein